MPDIDIDPEVFKMKQDRINALSHGRLTLNGLVFTIRIGDYLILYKNKIYALTEDQYYAIQQMQIQKRLSKADFQKILQEPPSVFSQQDSAKVQEIKNSTAKCSACKYNANKNKMFRIVQKYPELMKRYDLETIYTAVPQYPQLTAPIVPKVSNVFPSFFRKFEYDRLPCLDCVQKHVGMAYIKGCQSQQGYSEHLLLAVANLQEAYQECPKDCSQVRQMLMFCIAKTKVQRKAFIPLNNLLYVIRLARQETINAIALQQNQADQDFALQLDQHMTQDLRNIPLLKKLEIIKELNKLIDIQYRQGQHISVQYQGLLGVIADMLLPFSPQTSNMLRNRRLMFKACPDLVRNTCYDCKDLVAAMKTSQAPKN